MAIDELRNHDPRPTAEERAWMMPAAGLVFRAVALAGIAILGGVSASVVIERASAPPAVAAAPRAGS